MIYTLINSLTNIKTRIDAKIEDTDNKILKAADTTTKIKGIMILILGLTIIFAMEVPIIMVMSTNLFIKVAIVAAMSIIKIIWIYVGIKIIYNDR